MKNKRFTKGQIVRILRDAETKTIGAAARQQLDTWRQEYNVRCPHRALHDWTPAKFASNYAARQKVGLRK